MSVMFALISYGFYIVAIILGVICAVKLSFALRHYKMKQLYTSTRSLEDMPTVSVCIPARNETAAMTQCLERVVSSKYPKMEIIVLDDSSVDNTSILIKSFAHAGVRFVEGTTLPDGWLGKNHALRGLLQEASGAYVLYLDVDTHIEPDTIGQLVAYAEHENATMVSVLPTRRSYSLTPGTIFATLRRFWTMLSRTKRRAAASSNVWMIRRDTLIDRFSRFESHKSIIQPEVAFASELMREHTYRFLVSSPLLGITFDKSWRGQIETSTRLYYPLLSSRLITAFAALLALVSLLWPLVVLISALFMGWSVLHVTALAVLGLWSLIYVRFLFRVWPKRALLGFVLWPILLVQELFVVIRSVVGYNTRTITWKGRPITNVHQAS